MIMTSSNGAGHPAWRRNLVGVIVSTVCLGGISATANAAPPAKGRAPVPVIAFANGGSIYTADADGSHQVKRVIDAGTPIASPDGTRLAFARGAAWWVANIDGSGQTVVANSGFTASAWSPDNTGLVGTLAGGLGIETVVTKKIVAIPDSQGESLPRWTVDGTLIVSQMADSPLKEVLRRPDGSSRTVHYANADDPQNVHGSINGPFSPDGRFAMTTDKDTTGSGYPISCFADAMDTISLTDHQLGRRYSVNGGETQCTVPAWDYLRMQDVPLSGGSGSPGPVKWIRPIEDTVVPLPAGAVGLSAGGYAVPADTNGPPPAVPGLTAPTEPSYVDVFWQPPANTVDFAGVQVRYSLSGPAPSSVTAGLDGGRYLNAPVRLGPFAPGQHVSVSVFSLDWTKHVGPAATTTATLPAQAATQISVKVSPFDMLVGTTSTAMGSVTRVYDGAEVPNPALMLARMPINGGEYVQLGAVKADAQGHFTFKQAPGNSYYYRVSSAETPAYAATSGQTRIRVWRKAIQTVTAGTRYTLTVSTSPPDVHGKTYLEELVGGAVKVLGPHNTDAAGNVTYSVAKPPKSTSATYRVHIVGTYAFIDTWTSWATVKG